MGKLFLLFTIVPLIELYLLIEVGALLGAGPTIGIVMLTGFLGAALAKREGYRVLTSWRESMAKMQMPKEGVLSGLLVLVGGVLLVTPGVLTDFVGLSLLFPPTRRLAAKALKRYAERNLELRTVQMGNLGPGMPGPGGANPFGGGASPFGSPADVIDVDARPSRD